MLLTVFSSLCEICALILFLYICQYFPSVRQKHSFFFLIQKTKNKRIGDVYIGGKECKGLPWVGQADGWTGETVWGRPKHRWERYPSPSFRQVPRGRGQGSGRSCCVPNPEPGALPLNSLNPQNVLAPREALSSPGGGWELQEGVSQLDVRATAY